MSVHLPVGGEWYYAMRAIRDGMRVYSESLDLVLSPSSEVLMADVSDWVFARDWVIIKDKG